jgi:hypothetical protein
MSEAAKPVRAATKPRPGGRKLSPEEKALSRRHSGAELREALAANLPAMKAKRRTPQAILTGRPSTYTPEIGEKILALMSEGMTVTEACDALGLYRATVYRWAEREPFASILARAKAALAEHSFTQAASIPRELYARVLAGEPVDGATVAAARLYSDSQKWYAERLNPMAYGQQSKQSIELTGKGGGPIQTANLVIDSRALSPDARDALRAALEAATQSPRMIEGETLDESDT